MAKNDNQKEDGLKTTESELDFKIRQINTVLVSDPEGVIMVSIPIGRNMETKKMESAKLPYSEKVVPPEEVVYYTGSIIMDKHNSQSVTVDIGGKRTVVVFDRVFRHGKKQYNQCAWVPEKAIMAGVLFEKKIDRNTRQPKAVLRKLGDGRTPMFQIVGGKETDYRDLRKVYERVFFSRGGGPKADELEIFKYDSIDPISEELG